MQVVVVKRNLLVWMVEDGLGRVWSRYLAAENRRLSEILLAIFVLIDSM